jgi:dynein heavy chain 2
MSDRRSDRRSQSGFELDDVSSIVVPADELNFWLREREDRRSPGYKLAEHVDKALKDISPIAELNALEVASVIELVDISRDALNNVWFATTGTQDGLVYSQRRMAHLFDCIGRALVNYVQQQLLSVDMWASLTSGVRMRLQGCVRIIEQWCAIPSKLTYQWAGATHRWEGNPHEDVFALGFLRRLQQVQSILTISEELTQILTAEEKATFQLGRLFEPLRETNPIVYSPDTEPLWIRAVREYERLTDPVENAVATRFKRNISQYLDRPQLLLGEFQKYKNLMDRPTIRRSLISERETLLSLLRDVLKQMEASVDREDFGAQYDPDEDVGSRQGGYVPHGTKLTSPHVAGIVYLRQLGAKIAAISTVSKGVLRDLDGYPKFAAQCEDLIRRVQSEESGKFKTWLTDMNQKIEDGDDALRLHGSLMGWKDGVLVVNFSEELVRFLREFRQLDELGFDLPRASSGGRVKNITDRALEAEKFYRYGILLKKTANFYNSISEQMIDVQEQLLLGSLSSFASLVASKPTQGGRGKGGEGELTWSNPAECESYIKTLQDAAEKLSSENRWLRKVHESLCAQTVAIMTVDLHRQGELWKSKWRGMKEKMTAVRARYNEKDSKLWILHWDHQMYKAVETSYQMGLECVNESLPEIKIELVFANKALDFKPPLEQIRQSYYKELKKFVNIPYTFEGFGNHQIYKKMGARNAKRLVQVYFKAENLFDKLTDLLGRYAEWTALGQVDLDAYLEANVKTSEEYVANFKTMRSKRKDIDKLPDIEKIDCITVSLAPFKTFLDELLLRVGDSLLVNLRRSLIEEFKEVDMFLETSNERLYSKPKSVDEIGEAKRQWKEIDAMKGTMMAASRNCVEKKKLLLQYAPGTAIDISEITSKMANLDGEGGRWDDFEIALEAYNDIIEGQKEVLKGFLEEEEIIINVDVEKFGNKWRQLKPTDTKSWDPKDIQKVFDSLDDWKEQFASLQGRTTKHAEARVAFGMKNARFDGIEALRDDLVNTSKSWDMLKEYMAEEKTLADEDWINFTNVYVLQDFAAKWAENMKATFTRGSYDSVAEYIVTKVERIKRSVPALKYCKSEAFKEDHWTELLQGKLQLPRDLRADKLKVEHFLSKLDILMEPATLSFVKNLQARALGEVQIREAMQELRGWELSAEVKFLTQEESGRQVPLIKEWKDLFLEIGDKQSLLGSLKESPFFKAFADVGLALEAKISTLDFVLHTLNSIQRKWVYLEPIFSRGALPAEESRFKRVDESFKDIVNTVVRDPKLFYLADEQIFPKLSDNLRNMLDQLERCQKALTEFLEAKRSAMPRFYFIGDDDLLEILGQAKNPNVIQSHLKKLFQGIHKVKFDKDFKSITAMISSANEVVTLETPVPVNEKVEDWLEQLAQEMRATLAAQLANCLKSKTFDWNFPSQILCLAQSIKFTDDCEAAITEGKKGLSNLLAQLKATLGEFTSHDLSADPLMQLKMKSLVLDLVHNIDVVQQLQRKKTTKLSDWQWSKQLRYYFEKGRAVVRMHDAHFEYTYEYQGNAPKLVHTPLTDRCYLTLTQGMHMGFGGNPYGPAGTGKTESVKALASCMGRQVLVFNCDEALER